MIVQVRGVNFINKGAELMLSAVQQQMKILSPGIVVCVDLMCGSFQQRTQAGLYHLAWLYSRKLPYLGYFVNFVTSLIPKRLRNSLNIVRLAEVDVVLDASGFVYSDQQGIYQAERMAKYSQMMKRIGKKVILLPQAFGPFEQKQIRDAVCIILNNSDLVFARDATSLGFLLDLPVDSLNIKVAPDFTCLIRGLCPDYFNYDVKRPCIIPNYRMVDRTSSNVGEKYPSFLTKCIIYLIEQDLDPFILIHEDNDIAFTADIQRDLPKPIEIIQEPNPLYLKGILGNCSIVISSRYHGLIGALSQGVPSLATGWSHKYQMLLENYDCLECLLSVSASEDEIRAKIDMVGKGSTRADLLTRLEKTGLVQRGLVLDMWKEVYKVMSIGG